VTQCEPPPGYVRLPLDCDDNDAEISPRAEEKCDAIDNDCYGGRDFEISPGNTEDNDLDGYADLECDNGNDCNDQVPSIYPGAPEILDGYDSDCDPDTMEPIWTGDGPHILPTLTWYVDKDGDGYGDGNDTKEKITRPEGYVALPGDCDDSNDAAYPGALEVCDLADNDCDGLTDEGVPSTTYYKDEDGDDFGDIHDRVSSCGNAPDGYIDDGGDCDDGDGSIFPGALEVCDAVDRNCNDDPADGGAALDNCVSVAFNGSPFCTQACDVACDAGHANCDGDASNGCETDTSLSRLHCGGCNNECTYGCKEGVCVKALQVMTANRMTLAHLDTGAAFIWGIDGNGSLGNGNFTGAVQAPTPLSRIHGGSWRGFAGGGGDNGACALVSTGGTQSVRCWGQNNLRQLGWGRGAKDPPQLATTRLDGAVVPVIKMGRYFQHSCALIEGGEVRCFGVNRSGQIGNGATSNSVVGSQRAIGIDGSAKSATHVCVGASHSCALLDDGAVECWGQSKGTGTSESSESLAIQVPTGVTGIDGTASQAKALFCGAGSSCAILTNDDVMCWGSNSSGQLGTGMTGAAELAPVAATALNSLDPISKLALGNAWSCALHTTGAVSCWGSDLSGRLGDGGDADVASPTPVSVAGLDGSSKRAVDISSNNDHVCVVLETGEVECWGENRYGVIGDSSTEDRNVPTQTDKSTFEAVVQVASGRVHSCALMESGAVYCWGSDAEGQLGDTDDGQGNKSIRAVTSILEALDVGAQKLAAGASHTCAVLTEGSIACWGADNAGQVGDNEDGYESEYEPRIVPGLDGLVAVDIAASNELTCAVFDDGSVRCWGADASGQIGDGDDDELPEQAPVVVSGLDGTTDKAKKLGLGERRACAVLTDESLVCWGTNANGALGIGPTSGDQHVPATVLGGLKVADVQSGRDHTCALTTEGAVYCWGSNASNQLGNPMADATQESPLVVTGLDGVTDIAVAISTGDNHSCATLASGELRCWGANTNGELGLNTTSVSEATPQQVYAYDGMNIAAVNMSCGGNHTCALLSHGVVECWGLDSVGQLGKSGFESDIRPSPVLGL